MMYLDFVLIALFIKAFNPDKSDRSVIAMKMNVKKTRRIIAFIMLIFAVGFIGFALCHPEASWPWGNGVSYTIYGLYLGAMVLLFIAPFKK